MKPVQRFRTERGQLAIMEVAILVAREGSEQVVHGHVYGKMELFRRFFCYLFVYLIALFYYF